MEEKKETRVLSGGHPPAGLLYCPRAESLRCGRCGLKCTWVMVESEDGQGHERQSLRDEQRGSLGGGRGLREDRRTKQRVKKTRKIEQREAG